MEALWKLEDKWKITTLEALLLLACTTSLLIGLCTAAILRRKAQSRKLKMVHIKDIGPAQFEESGGDEEMMVSRCDESKNWVTIRGVLISSMRWSGPINWAEEEVVGVEDGAPPPRSLPRSIGRLERCESSVGRQSHNSLAAVWQRPILMGGKCELPRFSGLILYDEKGKPLPESLPSPTSCSHDIYQENPAPAVMRTTLQDLL